MISKKDLKNKRSLRIRSKVKRTSNLRLCAFRSSKHIYTQVIDDKKGKTLSQAMRILGFMKDDAHIDVDLFDIFVKQKIYLKYAKGFLEPEQIDEVNV